jgi:enoyl-CoA hydratase
MSEAVRMELDGGVAVVTIDRPPVNALRFRDIAEINDLFKEIEANDAVNVVVLTGAVDRVYELPVPVIAAINGPAIGSGVAFASAADIRIASTKANLHLPEVNLGVLGGSKHLARIAPQSKTRQMMYTGWPMGAEEGYRLGVFESVHEPGELMDEAMRVAKEIASKLPIAVRMAKTGLNRTEFMPLREGYALECDLTAELRNDPASAQQSKEFIAGGIKR